MKLTQTQRVQDVDVGGSPGVSKGCDTVRRATRNGWVHGAGGERGNGEADRFQH
jgi:hypothetical protein